MLALVLVLAATTLLSLSALALVVLRPPSWLVERALDPTAAAAFDRTPRPPAAAGGTRRLISVEILNARELAASRGRLASIAGSIAPGLTRRIVYDQTLRILRQQLLEQHVRADVRLHVLRPASGPTASNRPQVDVVDEPIDLGDETR